MNEPNLTPGKYIEEVNSGVETEISNLNKEQEKGSAEVEQIKARISKITQNGVENLKLSLFPLLQNEAEQGQASAQLLEMRQIIAEKWNNLQEGSSLLAKLGHMNVFTPAEIAQLRISTVSLSKQSPANFLLWNREFSEEGKESFLLNFFTRPVQSPDGQEGWREVNFKGNKKAEGLIGLGHMLESNAKRVMVRKPNGTTQEGVRALIQTKAGRKMIGYVDVNNPNNYLEVFDDYQFRVLSEIQQAPAKEPSDNSLAQPVQNSQKIEQRNEENVNVLKSENISAAEEKEILEADRKFLMQHEESDRGRERGRIYKKEDFEAYVKTALGLKDFKLEEPLNDEELENFLKGNFDSSKYDFGFDQMFRFFRAISQKESGGDYAAIGDEILSGSHAGYRAIGRYQIMADNWPKWAKNNLGQVLAPTPQNQDMIAFNMLAGYVQDWVSRGVDFENAIQLAAVNWYGNMGETLSTNINSISTRKAANGESPRSYAQEMLSFYKSFR